MKKRRTLSNGIELFEEIGQGATSVVYRARSAKRRPYSSADGHLAIKVFRRPFTGKASTRFERELQIGLSLTSPNLAKYYEYGVWETEIGSLPYVVMEMIEGDDLKTHISWIRGLEDPERLRKLEMLLTDIIRALRDLHENGIVHRDLHPGNIKVRPNGTAVLLDFGVSKFMDNRKLTSTWEEIGSRRYWAPECLRDTRGWGPKTDLFMAASCLIHLLTGKYPFSEARNYPDFYERLRRYMDNPWELAELTDLPKWVKEPVRAVVQRMLDPKIDHRPSANEILQLVMHTMDLPDVDKENAFPLSAFLWRLRTQKDAEIIIELGESLSERSHPNVSLKILFQKSSDNPGELIKRLCGWGLICPKTPTAAQAFIYHVGPDADNPYLLNEELVFEICPVAIKISEELKKSHSLQAVFAVRKEVQKLIQQSILLHRHYHDFDFVSIANAGYVVRPCDHHLWSFRVAVMMQKMEPRFIENYPILLFVILCGNSIRNILVNVHKMACWNITVGPEN